MIRKLGLTVALCLSPFAIAHAADLTITVKGARNDKGFVAAAIYASKDTFPKEGQQFAAFRIKANGGPVSGTLHGLPPGRYAVTAFHDENNDGKLDRDATGLPTEGYGVSNDARELLSPPYWDKASFEIGTDAKSVTVNIEY